MEISDVLAELERLKETLDQTKEKVAKNEGRLQSVMERLKTEFNLNSLDEVEEKIIYLKEELTIIDRKIEKEFTELKKQYEW